MTYVTAYTIVDGAIDAEIDIPDDADAQAILNRFVLDAELASKQDGLQTDIYLLPHYHAVDAEECECAQWLTDHKPAWTF